MTKKLQANLLRKRRGQNERLAEKDVALKRFKAPPVIAPAIAARTMSPRKSREKKAAAAAGRLEWLAAELAPVLPPDTGLIVLDGAGRVRSALGGSCEALGVHQENVVGTLWTNWVADEDRARWQAHFPNQDKNHRESRLSFRIASRSGHGLAATAYRAAGKESETWIVVRGQAARQRNADCDISADDASADDAVRRWAGVFAHELNQPLAAMLTTAQACRSLLATGKNLANEMAQGIDALVRRVQHAAEVVRCLRTLAGGEPPRRFPADLREVVRRALEVLQGPMADIGAHLTLDFAVGFPGVTIDSVQIVQVVVNLARNALEAMSNVPAPRRQLTVRAQFDSREATVAVEDQGVGLSAQVIQRLFQPFASTKAAGMGLGLALCRQIVEAHGGRIWAKGNSPNGCVFSFSVPLEIEEP